jgi:hypothetical protein
MILVVAMVIFMIHNSGFMFKYLVPAIFGAIFFVILLSIYKTGKYKKSKQVIAAVIGALLLVYFIYTCSSDD